MREPSRSSYLLGALLCGIMGSGHVYAGQDATGGMVSADGYEDVLPDGLSPGPLLEWSDLYSGDFPNVFNANRSLLIPRGEVLSLHFRTPSDGLLPGTLVYTEASQVPRAGYMSIALARGDFDPQTVGSNCVVSQAMGNPALAFTSSQQPIANRCELLPDSDYYINLHVGTAAQPGPDGSYCGSADGCSVIGGTAQF